MTRIRLEDIAHARSGDKGDGSNVGVIAYTEAGFRLLQEELTTERVKRHFSAICKGGVDRFEVPNLKAINFILHDSLGGGGSESVKTDAQGKTHGQALLRMELDLPDDVSLADLKPERRTAPERSTP
ncbi:MAG: hypothetical protein P4L11_05940 [Geothrix sp.]|nr:hypothetical protein [Geothrix sp.]